MYQFLKQCSALALVVATMVQCTKVDDISVGESHNVSATKIINTTHNAAYGSLLIKFNEEAVAAFEATRGSDVTRSNIESLNQILLDINATAIERAIRVNPSTEDEARAAGLHRWYIVYFDDKESLEGAAKSLSTVAQVDAVEFNTRIKRTLFPKAEYKPNSAATRVVTSGFNDPFADALWGLNNRGDINFNTHAVAGMDMNVYEAWNYTTGDSSIIVGVVDEGVDYTHADLVGNMWINEDEIPGNGIDDDNNGYVDDVHGYNFPADGPISWNLLGSKVDPGDSGHGTHVAGTIAAVSNNGIGISGIAGGDGTPNSGAKIMSLQIFSGNNLKNATINIVANAFCYAADNGASVINCSWGSNPAVDVDNDSEYANSRGLAYEAMEYLRKKQNHPNVEGTVIVCAAGNESYKQACYPGAYRENIAVTSYGINGYPAWYTNYGPGCNIAAPGGDQEYGENAGILSTITPNLYGGHSDGVAYYQGTSMASPNAAGVAVLGLAYAKKIGKKFTLSDFISKFLVSVNDIDQYVANYNNGKFFGLMGTGRIDALKFLMNLEGITCIPIPRGVQYYRMDVSQYLGDGEANFKLIDIEISEKDMEKLGMASKPRLMTATNVFAVTCNKTGSARVKIKMVGGGENTGTSDNIGGYTINKEFVLVVRDSFSDNGGWL